MYTHAAAAAAMFLTCLRQWNLLGYWGGVIGLDSMKMEIRRARGFLTKERGLDISLRSHGYTIKLFDESAQSNNSLSRPCKAARETTPLKVTSDILLLDQALRPSCSGSFYRFSLRGGLNATKGLQYINPIWESLRFGRGRRRFSDLIRTSLDISFIRSKLNASSHIHRDGGLLQRYMSMLQMGAPYNTSKKYLREFLFVWEEGILCTHQSSLDISFTRSKLKVRFRILRVGDLLPCWHVNATKGHDKLHRAWYGSPFFPAWEENISQTPLWLPWISHLRSFQALAFSAFEICSDPEQQNTSFYKHEEYSLQRSLESVLCPCVMAVGKPSLWIYFLAPSRNESGV